jgi:hypothetical protein
MHASTHCEAHLLTPRPNRGGNEVGEAFNGFDAAQSKVERVFVWVFNNGFLNPWNDVFAAKCSESSAFCNFV